MLQKMSKSQGMERGKGILDYYFNLPYSRGDVFVTKLVVGLICLVVSTALSFGLTATIIEVGGAQTEYFHQFYSHYIISLILAYTLTLAVEGMTGYVFAQGLTTFCVSILPIVIFYILAMNVSILLERLTPMYRVYHSDYFSPSNEVIETILHFTPMFYGFSGTVTTEMEINYWIPIGLSILFILIGYFAFVSQPFERNGSFFLWKKCDRPIQFLVIAIGVLGFSGFGYYSLGNSFIGYFMGAILGAFISFFICYFTIFKKTKQS